MLRRAVLSALVLFAVAASRAQSPAPTPPMGWSEWDAYGLNVTEADFRANAEVLARLRRYGWQYALLDAGWYEQDPSAHGEAQRGYVLDAWGRLIPASGRFPSAGGEAGFRPLADWLHARGLRFGIHVMPGVPRQAVAANLPIANSSFHAADAADQTQTCSWDREFYVAKDNAAGQAYYDSIVALYAAWGVDFIKLGCVADHPFHPAAIRQTSQAIRKSGRPIVLSLSPGSVPPEHLEAARQESQMVRFSAEHWDFWTPPPGATHYPVGLREDFDLFARASAQTSPGHWIDGDALPDGWLGPHPAWGGAARHSHLTADEQRSEFALWSFARAPLIEGASLTRLDPLTRSLMTNHELIAINQHAFESHPLTALPAGMESFRVWEAQTGTPEHPRRVIAFFNLADKSAALHISWAQLGLPQPHASARELWTGKPVPASDAVDLHLPAHASAIYEVMATQ